MTGCSGQDDEHRKCPRPWKRWFRHAPHLLGVVLMVAAIVVVQREMRQLSVADIRVAMHNMNRTMLLTGIGCTVLSYFVLSFYDRLAVIQVGHRDIPFRRTAFAAFCSYVLSHNLGFSAVSGAAVRFRLYRNWGVPAVEVAQIIAFCSATYLLGAAVLVGSVLILEPGVIPGIGSHLPLLLFRVIGSLFWLGALGYIAAAARFREITIAGHKIQLPSARMAIAQTIVSAADVAATAAIAYVLLPAHPGMDYGSFLAIYVASYTAGLIASVPGGLGVFDGMMLLALAPYLPAPQILGTVLVFRLFYYIVPLFMAGGMFAAHELFLRGDAALADKGVRLPRVGPRSQAEAPRPSLVVRESEADFSVGVATGTVSLCGILLLTLAILNPLPAHPDGHTIAAIASLAGDYLLSLIGAMLIGLAVGLSQRVTLAWGATLALLVLSTVVTFLRGNVVLVPLMLGFSAFLIAPFRKCYYRRARVLSEPLSFSTLLCLALLIGCVIALSTHQGTGSWWEMVLFLPLSGAARWAIALAVLLGLLVIARLFWPGRVPVKRWSTDVEARYRRLDHALAEIPGPTPDGVIFGEAGLSAIPYRRRGQFLVGLGDPAGAQKDCVSAIWQVRDLAMQEGLQLIFWKVSSSFLDIYADLGLVNLPLSDAPDTWLCCPPHQSGLVRSMLFRRPVG